MAFLQNKQVEAAMAEDRAKNFLQMIKRSQRGRLKIYLGYGPGVGKTYLMLQEAHRLKKDGIDVVVAVVETHGRVETAKQVEGLELVPRRQVEYHGIQVEEMDLDATLARRPQVALVDELAHTNVPGSRNAKRYEDVQELLAVGIHVIATLNVQHLESLYNTVERLVGVKVRERIPDAVLAEAFQVVNVDLTTEDLQRRLSDGKIYPKERIAPALENFFTSENLEHLRELTMREIASQIDFKRRELLPENSDKIAPDQVMVCLASKGPNSARLLRFTSRLAGRFNRNWYAVYIQTPSEAPTIIDASTQRVLSDTLTLANQLGATVFTFKGEDIVDAILSFAREYRVGHIVIGRPSLIPNWKRIVLQKRSVAENLVLRAKGFTVVIVDSEQDQTKETVNDVTSEDITKGNPGLLVQANAKWMSEIIGNRVLIFYPEVSQDEVLKKLAELIADSVGSVSKEKVLNLVNQREKQGSTFLNDGLAIPHAVIDELTAPIAAVAITLSGVTIDSIKRPIKIVVLLLEPGAARKQGFGYLSAATILFRKLSQRPEINKATSIEDVVLLIKDVQKS